MQETKAHFVLNNTPKYTGTVFQTADAPQNYRSKLEADFGTDDEKIGTGFYIDCLGSLK